MVVFPRCASVRIVEVGPRDGLQNFQKTIPTAIKTELIQRLQLSGLQTIELTSVVSPKAVPQLADCRSVLSSPIVKDILNNPQLRLPVLVPNLKGLHIAIENGVKEVAVFVSATEGFSKANINCGVQQGLENARQVTEHALSCGIAVRGYVSCVFACPYDGPTPQSSVLDCASQLLEFGCYEISLADTTGVGVAPQVKNLLKYLTESGVPIQNLAGHFHDTYGQAVSNAWAAYEMGMRVFDSSVGGLGGCPFAPGAKGNVATEDLVYMFGQAGVNTGLDLTRIVRTGVWISEQLSRSNESRAGSAMAAKSLAFTILPTPARQSRKIPENLRRDSQLIRAKDGFESRNYKFSVEIGLLIARSWGLVRLLMSDFLYIQALVWWHGPVQGNKAFR